MKDLTQTLIDEFQLGEHSVHGPSHWRRVEAYGIHLAKTNGGDQQVVRCFAVFHDCCRVNENHDPEHGLRGAEKAKEHRGKLGLEDEAFETLYQACAGHTTSTFSSNPTIAACWDADRLDLDRVGIAPNPEFLSTGEGKKLARLSAQSRRTRIGI